MTELPAWTFPPDWSAAILERIEWRTSVLDSAIGTEQRIATRYAPRRSIEARFLLSDAESTFLRLTLQRMSSTRFSVPLWFHRARLTALASSGASGLACDTVNREFRAGDRALVTVGNPFTAEAVTIETVSDTGVTLADPLTRTWPLGATVHPMRAGMLDTKALDLASSRVVSGSIRFDCDADNDLDGGDETFPLYGGYPVLGHRPNWAQSLSLEYEWNRDELDGETGVREVVDLPGRAFASTRYGIMLHGRDEQMAFRQLLYRLRGRQRPVWIPSPADDFVVAVAAASGASALEIDQVGLALVGGASADIAHMLVGNDLAVEWTGLVSPSIIGNEKLTLAAPLSRDVAVSEKARQLTLARLDQDVVTFTHETDSGGVATVALAWTAFDGSRDGSAAGDYPIPTTAMNDTPCGVSGCERPNWVAEYVVTLPDPLPIIGDADVSNVENWNIWFEIQMLQPMPDVNYNPAYWYFTVRTDNGDAAASTYTLSPDPTLVTCGEWTYALHTDYLPGDLDPIGFAWKITGNQLTVRRWWGIRENNVWIRVQGRADTVGPSDPLDITVTEQIGGGAVTPLAIDWDPDGRQDYSSGGVDYVLREITFANTAVDDFNIEYY